MSEGRPKLKVLDLFSGIRLGGFSLGLERTGGFDTAAFCEFDPKARQVLRKHWPEVVIHEDVRTLKGSEVGAIDVICGGYPCQPFSTAGKRGGTKDDRHLWPEMSRLVDELRPAWVIGENVAGHVSMGLDAVLSDLEAKGYSARPFIIPACAVDAQHRRNRVWILAAINDANADSKRSHREEIDKCGNIESVDRKIREFGSVCEILADSSNPEVRKAEYVANAKKLQRNGSTEHRQSSRGQASEFGKCRGAKSLANAGSVGRGQVVTPITCGATSEGPAGAPDNADSTRGWARWLPEPAVGRVADGIPRRVDRLRQLGNAVVPQIPEMIGHAILAAEAA